MRHWIVTWGLLAAGLGLSLTSSTSCTSRDCSEERAGQVRCVANRSEVCNPDGTLTYTSCTAMGLFCSEENGGCVTEDILNASGGGGSGPAGGAGGAPTTTNGSGGSPQGSGGAGATGGAPGGMGGVGGPAGGGGTGGAGGN